MPGPYGVTPTGFVRKPLEAILADLEALCREVFGEDIIQTAASPLGQLNGISTSLATTAWEVGEDVYQSADPDQAEGVRLVQLAKMRLLAPLAGETDTDFRRAITNADRARFDMPDIERAAAGCAGVTWVKAFVNGRCITVPGLPGRSVAVAVIGGADAAIAAAVRPFVAPGIDLYGNARVDLIVDGYCRTLSLVRPVPAALGLQLAVKLRPDHLGCPPPSTTAIEEAIANAFTGPDRPVNGADVTLHLLRTILAKLFPNVEIVSATANLRPDGTPRPLPYPIPFLSMATVSADDVTATVV